MLKDKGITTTFDSHVIQISRIKEELNVVNQALSDKVSQKNDLLSLITKLQSDIIKYTSEVNDLKFTINAFENLLKAKETTHAELSKKIVEKESEFKYFVFESARKIKNLNYQIEELKEIKIGFGNLVEEYSNLRQIVEDLNNKIHLKSEEIINLDKKIYEKQKEEKEETQLLKKERLDNENVLAKIENRKEYIEQREKELKEFCEINKIAFSI